MASPSLLSTVAGPVSASFTFIHLLIGQSHPCVPTIGTTALGQELVADTVHGSKMERPTSISFKFLTESQNVVVDGASAGIVLVTPHLAEQFVSRNDTSRVLRQVFQSLEFQARELHWLTFAACLHGRKAHFHIAEHKLAFVAISLGWRGAFSDQFEKL